jgi:hypothetical protein
MSKTLCIDNDYDTYSIIIDYWLSWRKECSLEVVVLEDWS